MYAGFKYNYTFYHYTPFLLKVRKTEKEQNLSKSKPQEITA